MIKIFKIQFVILSTSTFLIFTVLYHINNNIQTISGISESLLIPNIVHYVLFNNTTINFITFLSILSTIKVQKPSVIYIHANTHNFTGKYWNKLLQILLRYEVNIRISFMMLPTHVYGQRLSSVYHASDISRLFVLRKYGGIYLDGDMILINNVNDLRMYDCSIGWPKKDYIGSQFIIAKSSSEFLKLWQEGYKKYKPRDWYYNAGKYPTELLEKNSQLAHIESERFGVQYLLDKLLSTEKWQDWRKYYGIHVLYRHNRLFQELDEMSVQSLPTNFGDIARWILNLDF